MGTKPGPRFMIIDAETRQRVRLNWWHKDTVIHALYEWIGKKETKDYLIVDEQFLPVPVSRIR